MRCSTCGETLGPGITRCPTCGAVAPSATSRPSGVTHCPRCGYQGQGVTYFSRPGHVGLLVGVSLFTYGVGGLVYWLARRKHRVCPNCGLGWEHAPPSLPPASGHSEQSSSSASLTSTDPPPPLPSGGVKRRFFGTAMILFGTFLILVGIVEAEIAAAIVGSLFGASGSGTLFWGWKARQERRQALMTGLQRKVLHLATRRGGTLTVTEVATDLNLSIPAAEKVLLGMEDGFRVRSEVTSDGILLFEFPEVLHRARLQSGSSSV